MTSSEIGTWLENAGIIKHKQDLEDYLTAQNMTAEFKRNIRNEFLDDD